MGLSGNEFCTLFYLGVITGICSVNRKGIFVLFIRNRYSNMQDEYYADRTYSSRCKFAIYNVRHESNQMV